MKKYIYIVLILFPLQLLAQSSLSPTLSSHSEKMSLYHNIKSSYSPAVRPYQYSKSLSEFNINSYKRKEDLPFDSRRGKEENSLGMHANSYYKLDSLTTLWGYMNYKNITKKDIYMNSTADYELIYPHLIAYFNPTDAEEELYSFAGGWARKMGKYTLGVESEFRANQFIRKKDPRPRNLVNDISINAALSRLLWRDIGFNFGGSFRRYKQDLHIKNFANTYIAELFMLGPYLPSTRFKNHATGYSNDREVSYLYHGTGYGLHGGFFTKGSEGIDLQVTYNDITIDRLRKGTILSAITSLRVQNSTFHASYLNNIGNHRMGIIAKGNYEHKISAENFLTKSDYIGTKVNGTIYPYYSDIYNLKCSLLYGYNIKKWFSFELSPFWRLHNNKEHYLMPKQYKFINNQSLGGEVQLEKIYRRHMINVGFEYEQIKNKGADLDYYQVEGKQRDETKKMSFRNEHLKSLMSNFNHQKNDAEYMKLNFKYSFLLNGGTALFIGGQWDTYSYKKPKNKKEKKKKEKNRITIADKFDTYFINIGVIF